MTGHENGHLRFYQLQLSNNKNPEDVKKELEAIGVSNAKSGESLYMDLELAATKFSGEFISFFIVS